VDRSNGLDYLFQIDRLRALTERFQPEVILSERTGNRALADFLRRATYKTSKGETATLPITDFDTTNEKKAEIIQALALAFERRAIKIPDDPVLIGELEAFTADSLPSGRIRYAAPDGLHDDCVMSLAFAWHKAKGKIGSEVLTLDARVHRRLEEKGFSPALAPTDSTLPYWEMTKNIQAEKLYKEESRPMRYGPGAAEDAFDREVDGVPEWFQG
jgi:hypothetical protein